MNEDKRIIIKGYLPGTLWGGAGPQTNLCIPRRESAQPFTDKTEPRTQSEFMKKLHVGILGYTRDDKGEVLNYHENPVANTIHTFTGGGWTTDQFVIEVYEKENSAADKHR